jgi:methylthioribulose-1-phosphate dehydratase
MNDQTVFFDVAADTAATAVIEAGRAAAARGWAPATSGIFFSVRVDAARIAITRSGVDKGALQRSEVLIQQIDQPLRTGSSAEAPLHVRRYGDAPQTGAVFHVHSPAASVIGFAHLPEGALRVSGWELEKALRGVLTHEAKVEVPIFENDQNVGALAGAVALRLAEPPRDGETRAPGYLFAGHGLYAWGADAAEAWRHLEALETLFQQIIAYRSYRP